jgi:hypothetical protein
MHLYWKRLLRCERLDMNAIAKTTSAGLIVPVPKVAIAVRVGTLADLPFLDSMQKQFGRALGYFPTKQFEGYIEMGGVLVAEKTGGTLTPALPPEAA